MNESPSNDVWIQTFFDSTGMSHAWSVAGGSDTDGNGKPELFVSGNAEAGLRRTLVYEHASDDSFSCIAELDYYDGYSGRAWNAVTNLDRVHDRTSQPRNRVSGTSSSEEFPEESPVPSEH